MFGYHNNLLRPLFLNLFMTNRQAHRYDTRTASNILIIACIPVTQISRNSQFFTKDPGSGTVFLPLLPICLVFLPLKTVSDLVSAVLLHSPYLV